MEGVRREHLGATITKKPFLLPKNANVLTQKSIFGA